MKKIYLLAFTAFSFLTSYGQVTRVTDLNPGTDDGFDEWNHNGIELNGKFILPAKNATSGLELFVLENGSLTLLKDIYPGTDGSAPDNFIIYDNKVFFFAEDGTNGREIWSTDGTESGTQMAIEIEAGATSTNPNGMIVGNNNKLYFSAGGFVFISDGTSAGTTLITGVTNSVYFSRNSSFVSNAVTTYKDGIAFFSYSEPDYKFYYHDGTTSHLLSEVTLQYSTDVYGLTEVTAGLLYAVYHFHYTDLTGVFVIDRTTNNTSEILDANSDPIEAGRVLEFTDDKSIIKLLGPGAIYSTDGTQSGTVKIADGGYNLYSGEEIPHAVIGNEMVFFSKENFLQYTMSVTDGTVAGTYPIATIDELYLSQMISKGDRAYWAAGLHNGFSPQLWMADLSEESSTMLYEFTESSSTDEALIPITISGNSLYFLTPLKGDGRELYKYTSNVLGILSSVSNSQIYSLTSENEHNTFSIATDKTHEVVKIEQFDTGGKKIDEQLIETGNSFTLIGSGNMYLLKVTGKSDIQVFKILLR